VYRNLDAEQARFKMNNEAVAEHLGITRVTYERKKKSGKFTALEAKTLCSLFSCPFEYLFETADEVIEARG